MHVLIRVACAVALVSPTAAFADRPGRNWMAREKVVRILARKGYRVTKIEADDGHWEGEARRAGRAYEFHVDPRSGRVTKLERDRD